MTFSLNGKYTDNTGRHILTGIQALVKLPIVQRMYDEQDNLNTRGFISGYRGSPLGAFDQTCTSTAKPFLDEAGVDFRWGLNENLAATAVYGTQLTGVVSGSDYDGVFGMFYAKGPGIDQAGDALHHFNFHGTQKHGGVLMIAGDDHTAKSSSMPHQTDETLKSWFIPTFAPSNVKEILEFGLAGIAMSRYTGLWCNLKVIADICDSTQTINYDFDAMRPVMPDTEYDVSMRWPDDNMAQEVRILEQKLPAIQEFLKHNAINKITQQPKNAKVGVVAVGEAYNTLMTAIEELGIADQIAVLKLGMSWPLQEDIALEFAKQHAEIIVIEEKSALVENQLKTLLFDNNLQRTVKGKSLFSHASGIGNKDVAIELANCTGTPYSGSATVGGASSNVPTLAGRTPHFCSGCPHNTSTQVPDGAISTVGVGCHFMAYFNGNDKHIGMVQMGAEGCHWIGASDYANHDHTFANLGDGTYFHSGILAIRACIQQPDINITFKILKNDAVAMTGGQDVTGDSPMTTEKFIAQLTAEGIPHEKIAYVAEDLDLMDKAYLKSLGVPCYDKSEYTEVQEAWTKVKGTSAIIFDKQCATEKRRKLKRGLQAPSLRDTTAVYINPDVCEGCGDCTLKSKCLSVLPVETELGTKREINQESCNKDMTCVDGYCPSFVMMPGATPKKDDIGTSALKLNALAVESKKLPLPLTNNAVDSRFGILLSGIGGMGVMTVSQILALAGYFEGHHVHTVDQGGLAQKFGAVTSHISYGPTARGRIMEKQANLVIGGDAQTTGGADVMKYVGLNTEVVLNVDSNPGFESLMNPSWSFDSKMTMDILESVTDSVNTIQANHLAKTLLGNSIGSTIMMVGYAYQKGLLPLSEESLTRAITEFSKGDSNINAFTWGRVMAHNPEAVVELVTPKFEQPTLTQAVDKRIELLTAYQSKRYANKYRILAQRVTRTDAPEDVKRMFIENLFDVFYIKDDYEVSRLWNNTLADIDNKFDNVSAAQLSLSLPWQRKAGTKTKVNAKLVAPMFKVLQHGKVLRNTVFDILANKEERKLEKQMRDLVIGATKHFIETGDYNKDIITMPSRVKGYGHVRLEKLQSEVK